MTAASSGPVAVQSATCASVGTMSGGRFAGLRALPGKLGLTGRRLEVAADDAELDLLRASLRGERVDAAIERVRVTAERVETIADRAVQRFKNVFEKVEGLKQQRLGRLRALVGESIEWQSQRATLVTEREVRIDGEQIHLG